MSAGTPSTPEARAAKSAAMRRAQEWRREATPQMHAERERIALEIFAAGGTYEDVNDRMKARNEPGIGSRQLAVLREQATGKPRIVFSGRRGPVPRTKPSPKAHPPIRGGQVHQPPPPSTAQELLRALHEAMNREGIDRIEIFSDGRFNISQGGTL